MDAGSLLAIITGILGLSGLIFTALRYNRDDSKSIVEQQSAVLKDMAALNDQEAKALTDARAERDALRTENERLRDELARRPNTTG